MLEKGHQYDGRNRFVTWLMSIGHNVAIDYLRKTNPSSLDEMKDPEDGAPFEPPATGPSPFDLAAAQQQHEMFRRPPWGRCSAIFREVLVLRFQEQMKLEEIAQLIHIPRVHRKDQNLSRRDGIASRAEGRRPMTNREHERAIDLITRRGVEDIAAPDAAGWRRTWRPVRDCADYADDFGRALASCCGRLQSPPVQRW